MKAYQTLQALVLDLERERNVFVAALRRIANINNGPDRASGDWRCREAEAIARDALTAAGENPDPTVRRDGEEP